ncbi:hypothetical protein KC853_03055, partial [Candidatus Saccharibacteria bacterium]|nr:hypothetical protein [Candidatus Saccharibacteria bacterium]
MTEQILDREYPSPIRPNASYLGMYSLAPNNPPLSSSDALEEEYLSIIRNLYTKIAKYLQKLPGTLLSILNNTEVDERLKLKAIGQIGVLPEHERLELFEAISNTILSILNNPEGNKWLKLEAIGQIGVLPEHER